MLDFVFCLFVLRDFIFFCTSFVWPRRIDAPRGAGPGPQTSTNLGRRSTCTSRFFCFQPRLREPPVCCQHNSRTPAPTCRLPHSTLPVSHSLSARLPVRTSVRQPARPHVRASFRGCVFLCHCVPASVNGSSRGANEAGTFPQLGVNIPNSGRCGYGISFCLVVLECGWLGYFCLSVGVFLFLLTPLSL